MKDYCFKLSYLPDLYLILISFYSFSYSFLLQLLSYPILDKSLND